MKGFVSVIVPNYCHSRYLDLRLESILNQTYKNFEIIILDDNSPDNGASKEVIERYRNNPYVSHISYNEVNSGSTFKQWNKGIAIAKGDYIWIAESDDFCKPNLLESLMKIIEKRADMSFCYTLSQHVNAAGMPINIIHKSSKDRVLSGVDFIKKYMYFGNPVQNVSSAIIRKSFFQKIDKNYETFVGAGDVLFWIELAELGSVGVVNKPLNFYRQHDQKVTPKRELDGTNLSEAKKCFDYMCNKGYIKGLRKGIALGSTFRVIRKQKFENDFLRHKMLNVWGWKPTVYSFLMILIARLLGKLRVYNIYI